ncbi:hypothetical protein L602_000600000800 [Cupriavidus gilardii J11]|uniref:DUF1853 family protein n=1 Tax=Cupriavidus gilardii J11 TaxID=936133 RepID=A0A562B446_9BURK|nr:DUF1853 family protein [Cupriavidus gilardii]TWG79680.1 hypothetical protein L602_000600000800 [Cupriavidus gilardii J11]
MRERPADGIVPVAGAAGTPLWRDARDRRVRELAWCTLAPPLMQRLPVPGAGLAPNGIRLARLPAHALAAWQGWLAQADPAQLPPTIDELAAMPTADRPGGARAERSLRLGRHAERLLRFALERMQGIELVAANLPVRRQGPRGVQTLGELDFVWRDLERGELVHWEMAAKFYLLADSGRVAVTDPSAPFDAASALQAFVGPNLVDRLGDKLRHVMERQLPLSGSAEALALLGAPVSRSEIYLLGWLFYRDGVMPPDTAALGLAPDHLHGWWSTLDDWACRHAGDGGTGTTRWHRLPRARWLSPALVPEVETESWDALLGALTTRFAEPQHELSWRRESPVMVCEMEPAGSGWWRERSRGFVVPPGWEARARLRAGERAVSAHRTAESQIPQSLNDACPRQSSPASCAPARYSDAAE